jgi:hypothetical protein
METARLKQACLLRALKSARVSPKTVQTHPSNTLSPRRS